MLVKTSANAAFLCLLALLALTASSFSQRISWTYDVMPSANEQFVTLHGTEPYLAPNGDSLFSTTWFMSPSGGYQTGFIWLSAKGAKLAEFRTPVEPFTPGYMRVLNVTTHQVCVLLSDLGGFYIRTYRRAGGNLTLVRSVSINEFDESLRVFSTAVNRRDAAGIFVCQNIRNSEGNVVGSKITRYLF